MRVQEQALAPAGCFRNITVDAISYATDRDRAGKVFVLIPTELERDYRAREFKETTEVALMRRGFRVTQNPADADIIAIMNWLTTEPQTYTETGVVPVPTYTPAKTTQFTAQTYPGYGYGTPSSTT